MGDVPIFVAHDSADVWARPDLFELRRHRCALRAGGRPSRLLQRDRPALGQPALPLGRDGARGLRLVDRAPAVGLRVVRPRAWITSAVRGALGGARRRRDRGERPLGEGAGLAVRRPGARLGPLPIVAENLGVITPEVEALRERYGFPGMAVLQFAFGSDPQSSSFIPHNLTRDVVVYTGTHDNDTTVGWWTAGVGDTTRTEEDGRRSATACAYPAQRRDRDPLGLRPRRPGIRRGHGDRPAAGRPGAGQRGAHERAGARQGTGPGASAPRPDGGARPPPARTGRDVRAGAPRER